jgi:hypothetical protein
VIKEQIDEEIIVADGEPVLTSHEREPDAQFEQELAEMIQKTALKMNFYLSAVNDFLRHPDDQPSIGIILCKTRDRFIAEYALRDINKPIGISEYRLAESLPEKLKGSLPTIEELETELGAASAKDSA